MLHNLLSVVVYIVPERHVAEGVVPFTKRIRYTNPDIYGQVCQRLGWPSSRLPTSSEEAEAFVSALRGKLVQLQKCSNPI